MADNDVSRRKAALRNVVNSVSELTVFARALATRGTLRSLPSNNSCRGAKRRAPPKAGLLLLLLGSVRRLSRVVSPRAHVINSETELTTLRNAALIQRRWLNEA